jgi:hypothetical protein
MYNLKTKEVKSITDVVTQALNVEVDSEKVKNKKRIITEQDEIKKATVALNKSEIDQTDKPAKSTPVIKKELKSHMQRDKVETTVIRKTVGGGS